MSLLAFIFAALVLAITPDPGIADVVAAPSLVADRKGWRRAWAPHWAA